MRTGLIPRWFIALLFPTLAHASQCGITGSAETRVQSGGTEYFGSATIDQCQSLHVLNGPVTLCYHDRLFRLTCTTLESGASFTGDVAQPQNASWLDWLLKASPQRVSGGVRGAETRGLPYGPILVPRSPLVIPLPEGTQAFTIADGEDDKTILQTLPGATVATVVPGILKASHVYRWELTIGNGFRRGTFETIAEVRQTEIEARIARAQGKTPAELALARALTLAGEDLEFDAERQSALARK